MRSCLNIPKLVLFELRLRSLPRPVVRHVATLLSRLFNCLQGLAPLRKTSMLLANSQHYILKTGKLN